MPFDIEAFKNTCLGIGAVALGLGYSYGQFRGGNRRANTEQLAQHNLEREDWKGQRAALEEKVAKLVESNSKLTSDLQAANSEIASLRSFVTLTTAPPAIVQLTNESTKQVLDRISKFEELSVDHASRIEELLTQIASYLEDAGKK